MKKWMYIAAAAFVVVALAALLAFTLTGDPVNDVKQIDLTGTWRIAANVTYGKAEMAQDEFLVINENTATLYRGGEKFASSKYEVGSGSVGQELRLPEISRTYVFEKRTDDYFRLYENANLYMEVIRHPNADMSSQKIGADAVKGNWEVVYRRSEVPSVDERLVLGSNMVEIYRAGELSVASACEWTAENALNAKDAGLKFEFYPLSQNEMFAVQEDLGAIWQFRRAK